MAAVSADAEREIKEAIEKAKSGALSTFVIIWHGSRGHPVCSSVSTRPTVTGKESTAVMWQSCVPNFLSWGGMEISRNHSAQK